MRLYRLLLGLLLPPGFRREWGHAMADEARTMLAEARGAPELARVHLMLLEDVLRAGAREWFAAARGAYRGEDGMRGMWTDVKVGARGLRRAPGYTLAAGATLAVAVGVNAVVFAMIDAVMLVTLPYRDADRLVALWTHENWSRAMVDAAGRELRTVDDVAGHGGLLLTLAEGAEPVEVFAAQVTTNLHTVLGVEPATGRGFTPDDALAGAEPVALLAHDVWVDRFGADPGVVGRSIALGGSGASRRRVVGVLPADHRALAGRGVEVWVPVTFDPAASEWSDSYFMQAVARMAPGVSVDEVATDIRGWAEAQRAANPGWFSDEDASRANVLGLERALVGDRRAPLLLALAGVGLLLLVACANVANLALARTGARERELSVRTALGAGRARTVRLVLSETILLGALGAVGGAVIAAGLRALVERSIPTALPPGGLNASPGVLAATLAVALGTALAAGLAPALRAAARDPARALAGVRGATHDRASLRLQGGLVAAQLALATVLVTSAALLARSLGDLSRAHPGFEAEGALTFRLTAPPDAYPADADVVRFFREARSALAAVPGVEHVGFVSRLPMGGGMSRISVYPEGMEILEGTKVPEVDHRLVTPGYLEAMGARLRAGAHLTPEDDREGEVVAGIVNRAAAERFWPGEGAVGKHFLGREGALWVRVLGVVEDLSEAGVERAADPALYLLHRDWPWATMTAVVRTRGAPDVDRLEAAVWSVSARVPVSRVRTLEDVVASSYARVRLLAVAAAVLGAVALILGMLGVYGVASYAAGRRRAEFGVRSALGAGRARLQRTELLRAGRIVGLGVSLGLPGAWLAARALRSALVGIAASLPAVLLPVAATLATAGLLAAWLPVRRATRVDPVEALRAE